MSRGKTAPSIGDVIVKEVGGLSARTASTPRTISKNNGRLKSEELRTGFVIRALLPLPVWCSPAIIALFDSSPAHLTQRREDRRDDNRAAVRDQCHFETPAAKRATALAAALLAALASYPGEAQEVEGRGSVNLEDASVTASDRQVNVGRGGKVTLTTILPLPARETIVLKDMKGSVVRTLVDRSRIPGTYKDAWDGKGDGGRRLKDDQYRWVAVFTDGKHSFRVDRSREFDGDFELKSHPEYPPWDPFSGSPLQIRHTFERPGEIALVFSRSTYNVSPRCDPPEFFCRFLDGYWPAGDFSYEWAGVDDSGVFRPDIHAIFVVSHHEELSKNAIVTYGGRPSITQLGASPAYFRPDIGGQDVTLSLKTFRNERASVVFTWTNQESRSVLRTLVLSGIRPGLVKAAWDGRADNGVRVAPGNYTLRALVTDSLGQKTKAETLTTVVY